MVPVGRRHDHLPLGGLRQTVEGAPMATDERDAEEQALVERCLAREEAAWRLLDQRYGERLRVWAREQLLARGLRDRGLAEEVVQTVFTDLLEHDLERLRHWDPGRASLSTYLTILARPVLRASYRALSRRKTREAPLDRK